MIIMRNTTFLPGQYELSEGIVIGADGVTLHMSGVVLAGSHAPRSFGLWLRGRRGVRVFGGSITGFYYGLGAAECDGLMLESLNVSRNWLDPAALGPKPPWLDINAPYNLSDTTNLGGGVLLHRVAQSMLRRVIASNQQNGFNLFECRDVTLDGNTATDNVGWGAHLNSCERVAITNNELSRCNRKGLGDSASILLVNGSHFNMVEGNICTHSGDGFFIGNEHGCPSNDNVVRGNDCSYASANAFEATFAARNRFEHNNASHSRYGFWLGYSHNTTVAYSTIVGNAVAGVQADHAQALALAYNTVSSNHGPGILLATDGAAPFPASRFPCLKLPAQRDSTAHRVVGNAFASNSGPSLELVNTTATRIAQNRFAAGGAANVVVGDGRRAPNSIEW